MNWDADKMCPFNSIYALTRFSIFAWNLFLSTHLLFLTFAHRIQISEIELPPKVSARTIITFRNVLIIFRKNFLNEMKRSETLNPANRNVWFLECIYFLSKNVTYERTCIASLYTWSRVYQDIATMMANDDKWKERTEGERERKKTSRAFLSTTWALIIETKPKWQHDDYKHTLNEKTTRNSDKCVCTHAKERKNEWTLH